MALDDHSVARLVSVDVQERTYKNLFSCTENIHKSYSLRIMIKYYMMAKEYI